MALKTTEICPSCGNKSLVNIGHHNPDKSVYSWRCGFCGLKSPEADSLSKAYEALKDALLNDGEPLDELLDDNEPIEKAVYNEETEQIEIVTEEKPVRTFANPNRKPAGRKPSTKK